ncbi:hypothetical protein [Paenibacillus sp. MMS18-CY102]|uniref:hypothetical protein n=1 Tax=Paenibacillus sp. MMS18-CY102 TaxID=2682849 RepID=UPI00136589F4|nr:hypothetical protein [Paenibacillus sp. MMS18-CY102]MWC29593.1 hypothetical protein [Paenibacillus sp. MMS18-CY102]
MNWYALCVETGKEHKIKELINQLLNFECVCIFSRRVLFERKEEIDIILSLLDAEGVLHFSNLSIQGRAVKVESGPLKKFEDKIIKVDRRKKRAKIKIDLLESTKIIEVGIEKVLVNSDEQELNY